MEVSKSGPHPAPYICLRRPVKKPTRVRNNDCVGCHASTRRDSSGDHRVHRVGYPTACSEQVDHVAAIAKLDLASCRNLLVADSHSTTAPMSPTACIFDWGTSQNSGKNPPRGGSCSVTNLPNRQPVGVGSTSSG